MSKNLNVKYLADLAIGGFWGAGGGLFIGIIVGAATGWVSGAIVGVNPYKTALVGSTGGALVGLVGGLIVGIFASNVSSPTENKLYGQKLAKMLLVGCPVVILMLFGMTIVTLPLHDFLLENYIVPFILPPPRLPTKQELLPRTAYKSLPTVDRGTVASSFYTAPPSSLFTEINVFKDINTGSRGKESPLALVDNTLYLTGFLGEENQENGLSLISANIMNGQVNWQVATGDYFLATDSQYIYAPFPGSGNTGITAYDKNSGEVMWQTPFPFGVAIGIEYLAVTGPFLNVKTYHRHQGAFYVINPTTGKILIQTAKTDPDKQLFIFMIENGVVYEWLGNSITASGDKEWKAELAANQDFYNRELAAPIVTDELFLIRRKYPAYSPITAIDKQTGSIVWEIAETAVSNLAVDQAVMFFVTKKAELRVVEVKTGKVLGSLEFSPAFGEDFYFPNNSILVAADKGTVAVYFEDKRQLSIFHFEGPVS